MRSFPAVIAYGRLLILGNDSQKLHEEVITAGGILKEGRFSRLNVMKIREALAAANGGEIQESTKESLVKLWDSYAESLLNSLEKRGGLVLFQFGESPRERIGILCSISGGSGTKTILSLTHRTGDSDCAQGQSYFPRVFIWD